jgi:hypothetical protein
VIQKIYFRLVGATVAFKFLQAYSNKLDPSNTFSDDLDKLKYVQDFMPSLTNSYDIVITPKPWILRTHYRYGAFSFDATKPIEWKPRRGVRRSCLEIDYIPKTMELCISVVSTGDEERALLEKDWKDLVEFTKNSFPNNPFTEA